MSPRATFLVVALTVISGCSLFESGEGGSPSAPVNESTFWNDVPGFSGLFGDWGTASGDPASREMRLEVKARGDYLLKVAACGSCHGADPKNPSSPLTGGRMVTDEFGEVVTPNITPDVETGIGRWTVPELVRAIRASIDKDGRPLSITAHEGYRWLADRDAQAIAVALQELKVGRNSVERRRLGGFERNKYVFFPRHSEVKGYVPELQPAVNSDYGYYLATSVTRCAFCHTGEGGTFSDAEPMGGSDRGHGSSGMFSSDDAAPVFPAGGPDIRSQDGKPLASWSDEDLVKYLSSGITKVGKRSSSLYCPWSYFSTLSPDDMKAIVLYIKRL